VTHPRSGPSNAARGRTARSPNLLVRVGSAFGWCALAPFGLSPAMVVSCMPKCREPVAAPCPSAAAQASASAVVSTPAASAPKIVTPDGPLPPVTWSDEELAKDVALKTVRQTEGASYHVVRLLRAERPHAHDRSDLSVFVLSGAVNMHIAGRIVPLAAGDVVEVPKGVPHWAENASSGASMAYVVFVPAFDGKDRRPVEESTPAPGSAR